MAEAAIATIYAFDLLGGDKDDKAVFRDTWKYGKFPKNVVKREGQQHCQLVCEDR